MSALSLEIVLDLKSLPALVVWERLYSSHRDYLDGVGEVDPDGKVCRAKDVAKRIERSGRPHFSVTWNGDQMLDYSRGTNYDLSFVQIQRCVRGEEDAEVWLAPFLTDKAFCQAWLFDEEYEFWQNAYDFLQYEVRGMSYAGLPLKSNGLPAPLEQTVIDTSRNPGRRVLRRGFVEAVGCPMWLGEGFWSIVGVRRDVVCAEDWLRCETLPGKVVRLKPADAPFTSADGKAGELQDQLRTLLYPNRNRDSQ